MLNHSVFRKWVPIPKGYTNPTPSLQDRENQASENFKKVLPARFQDGTQGQRLPALFSGWTPRQNFQKGLRAGVPSPSKPDKPIYSSPGQ